MIKQDYEKTSILGVNIDLIDPEKLIKFILYSVRNHNKTIISYVNVHTINLAYEILWFKEYLNQSQIVFCDGMGVKWAIKILNGKNLIRLTPPDWFGRFVSQCSMENVSMYFLGTQQRIVEKAAHILKGEFPDFKILGVHHGFFNKEPLNRENQEVLAKINSVCPDILVVGFGMPLQEKWIKDNLDQLQVKVVITVGAYLDYLAGEVPRAPRWMTDNGLEWLGRFIVEPQRLWKRYLIGNPLFIWRVIMHHVLGFPIKENKLEG